MTPQERQLIDDLFDRLSRLESAPRDPEAAAAIAQGLRTAPNAFGWWDPRRKQRQPPSHGYPRFATRARPLTRQV